VSLFPELLKADVVVGSVCYTLIVLTRNVLVGFAPVVSILDGRYFALEMLLSSGS
jgi:hypothetical protein